MKNTTKNLKPFISFKKANEIMKVTDFKPFSKKPIGDGYHVFTYNIPKEFKEEFEHDNFISNIMDPSGNYVLPGWIKGFINVNSVNDESKWLRISYISHIDNYSGTYTDKQYYNYVNLDGEFLLDSWVTEAYPFKNGFAEIKYKGLRCKLYPDGTIERWNANNKKEPDNFCTKEDFERIQDEYDDIAEDLKINKGVISFVINYDDFVGAGYSVNSRLFLTRDAHSWNEFKGKDYYSSHAVLIRISKPPRANGSYNLYIKKSASYDGIDINPLKTIEDVINALNKRIMTTYKDYYK